MSGQAHRANRQICPNLTIIRLHFQATHGKVTERQEQPDEYKIAQYVA